MGLWSDFPLHFRPVPSPFVARTPATPGGQDFQGASSNWQKYQSRAGKPTGGGNIAVAVGYSWVQGTLTYRGKTFPVKVKGLSVREVGVSE